MESILEVACYWRCFRNWQYYYYYIFTKNKQSIRFISTTFNCLPI